MSSRSRNHLGPRLECARLLCSPVLPSPEAEGADMSCRAYPRSLPLHLCMMLQRVLSTVQECWQEP